MNISNCVVHNYVTFRGAHICTDFDLKVTLTRCLTTMQKCVTSVFSGMVLTSESEGIALEINFG